MPFVFVDFTGTGFAETRDAGFAPAVFGAGFFGAAVFFAAGLAAFTGLAAFVGLRAGALGAGLRAAGFFAGCAFFAGFAGFAAFFFAAGFAAGLRLLVAISCHHCPSAVACYSLSRLLHQQLICRPSQVTRIILALIAIYKSILSPLFGPRCRFHPTCSDYARAAVNRFGAGRGSLLALWRIARCQPLCAGGIDPVPDKFTLPTCRHKEFPA